MFASQDGTNPGRHESAGTCRVSHPQMPKGLSSFLRFHCAGEFAKIRHHLETRRYRVALSNVHTVKPSLLHCYNVDTESLESELKAVPHLERVEYTPSHPRCTQPPTKAPHLDTGAAPSAARS
mmetsp:Transcript_121223/g.241478  ORF Transcript_121223/g.241478 Transcript_121223/m.241478 type:complete len:123 (+) Transcript_121223:174-542(+)